MSTAHLGKNYTWLAGVGGHGKTLLMRALYRARIRRGRSGVFVDPTGKNGDLGTVFRRVQELPKLLKGKGRPFSFVYQQHFEDDAAALWPMLSRIGSLVAAVDEAGQFLYDRPFVQLIQTGRNNGIDLAATFQGPADLPPRVRQQADVWICFRMAEPDYARQMEEKFFRTSGAAAKLLALPKLHYLRATLDGGFQDVTGGVVPCPTCGPLAWLQPHPRPTCPLRRR